MAFRDRMVAFQEQLDLWRKFEDEAMQEEVVRPAQSGVSSHGTSQSFAVPQHGITGSSQSASQSYPNLTGTPSNRSPSSSRAARLRSPTS